MSSTEMVPVSTSVDVPDRPWESQEAVFEHRLFREDGDLDPEFARQVVAKMSAYATVLYRLVGRAHERRIWSALGYSSWLAFVDAEFDISKSRAYQLVHQYRANKALEAGSDSSDMLDGRTGPHMSEAQARPLGNLSGDERAVRQIWERALVLARGGNPTAADVAQAVAEYRNPPPFVPPAEPLVDSLVRWIAGPVWWLWTTPPAGTVLHVGLGEPKNFNAMLDAAWFTSPPRPGDFGEIRRLDTEGLLPWILAELLTGGRTLPELDAAAAIAELELAYIDRGPYTIDKDEVVAALAEAAGDEWEDVSTDGALLDHPVPADWIQFSYAWRSQPGGESYCLDVWGDGEHLLWTSGSRPWSGGTAEMQADARTVLPQVMAEALLGRAVTVEEVAAVAELSLSWAKPKKSLNPFWINRSFIARQLDLEPGPKWGDQNRDDGADPVDDEVLRGELVDRTSPSSADEPEDGPVGANVGSSASSATPDRSNPPDRAGAGADAGVDGDPASSTPAPSAEQVELAKLRNAIRDMSADDLLETIERAIDVATRTADPDDKDLVASVLRATASRFADEASALRRETAA